MPATQRPSRAASAGVGAATAAVRDTPNDLRDLRAVKKHARANRAKAQLSVAKRAEAASLKAAIAEVESISTWPHETDEAMEVEDGDAENIA